MVSWGRETFRGHSAFVTYYVDRGQDSWHLCSKPAWLLIETSIDCLKFDNRWINDVEGFMDQLALENGITFDVSA